MTISQGKSGRGWQRTVGLAILAATIVAGASATGFMMSGGLGNSAKRPAASEFGLGPRASTLHRYTAVLRPPQPLRPRRLQMIQVFIADSEGRPVDGATITVDGGMPQHGHGLPTKPRVTRSLGGGIYEIEGVRFNMGGWWEFKLTVTGPSGIDIVTFNLDL